MAASPRDGSSSPVEATTHGDGARLLHGILFALLVAVAPACDRLERNAMPNVPALGGDGYCYVKVGDLRTHVLMRCGESCGGGSIADGRCPPGSNSRSGCENLCKVYRDVEVCFADDRVVTVRYLSPHEDRFEGCRWPGELEDVTTVPTMGRADAALRDAPARR